jgi:heptosyltransferase-1
MIMKFLIVKTSSLGDIIQAFPTLFFLKERFPEAQIDWVVEERFAQIVESVPLIDHVIYINSHRWRNALLKKETWTEISKFYRQIRKEQYDVVFDLQGNCKSGVVAWNARAKDKVGFGRRTVHELPNIIFTNKHYNPPQGYNIREDYLFLARSYFKDESPLRECNLKLKMDAQSSEKITALLKDPRIQFKPRIMICPGSAWPNKRLTQETLEKFMQLINDTLSPSFILVWGSSEEKDVALAIQNRFPDNSEVIDKLSISALQNLMWQVELIISMDSLPLHLAGLTPTPTFSIFGASFSSKYKPIGNQHRAFQGACPYGRIFEKRCPILRTCPTGACIHTLDAKALFIDFINWWTSLTIEE